MGKSLFFTAGLALALVIAPTSAEAYWFPLIKKKAQTSTSIQRGDRNASISASSQTGVKPVPRVDTAADKQRQADAAKRRQAAMQGQPDVYLDIPNLSVDKIELEVENVSVHVALDARVANLVKLTAGADVSIEKVKLVIEGVRAEALLVVRLDNVREILDRTLTTLDRNPEVVMRLLQSVDNTVGTVGNLGGKALDTLAPTLDNLTKPGGVLTQTVNTLGQTVQTTIDATGNIVEKTVDTTGSVLATKDLGNLLKLQSLSQITNEAGQTVRRVRDTSGRLIEFVTDKSGALLGYRLAPTAGQTTKTGE